MPVNRWLALTIGDPAGIGPEICLRLFLEYRRVYQKAAIFLVGNLQHLTRLAATVFPSSKRYRVQAFTDTAEIDYSFPNIPVFDVPEVNLEGLVPGRIQARAGKAAYSYLNAAFRLWEEGRIAGMVTAPISKAALQRAGVPFSGHTELLAAMSGVKRYGMLLLAKSWHVLLVTRHIPLGKVASQLTVPLLTEQIYLALEFLRSQEGLTAPQVAVCSLNPHGGEGGLLGREENTIITPAIRLLQQDGQRIEGPLPVETIFRQFPKKPPDLVVALYHDQGMLPLKLLAAEQIVNLTLGLPFIRTSPGHGTAFDLVGKRTADVQPLLSAVQTAASLIKG